LNFLFHSYEKEKKKRTNNCFLGLGEKKKEQKNLSL